MRIACIQSNPIFKDVASNLKRFEEDVSRVEADLVISPELALTGYFFTSADEARKYAEPLTGDLLRKLQSLAKENNIAIVTGILEEDSGRLYNSAIAIDANGKLVGHYRKVHLFYYEKVVFSPGDLRFPVFTVDVRNGEQVKLGMMICYDWRFPEAARTLALKGAQVIAVPSNIVTTTGMLHETLKVRAFENEVILAFADRIGKETAGAEQLSFRGESCIINYNGEILAKGSTDEESIVYADVFIDGTSSKTINKFNDIIGDRQNKSYFA
jgi:predicted amidohydrolase